MTTLPLPSRSPGALDAGERRSQLLLTLLFLASRLAVFRAGIVPHSHFVLNHWQNIDPQLMLEDLPRSLFYLHAQPPLWNAALAVLVRIAGGANGRVMWLWMALAWAMSLAIALIVQHLVRRLSGRGLLATGAGAFWVLLSSAYFYENYIFYTLPTAFLACLCGLGAYQAGVARSPARRLGWFSLVLSTLLALTLTWPLFHPVLVPLGGVVLLLCLRGLPPWRPWPRGLLIATVLATLLALVVPLKNQLLYGSFSSSSWIGLNLMDMAKVVLPKEGPWSACGFDQAPSPEEIRLGRAGIDPVVAAHPVNSQPLKSGSTEINANHLGYAGRSQSCLALFREQLRSDPLPLLRNRWENVVDTSTRLSDDYWNRHGGLEEGSGNWRIQQARNAIYLRMPWMANRTYAWMSGRHYLLPLLAQLALVLLLPLQWWRLRRRGELPAGWTAVLATTLVLLLWVVVMGNLANYAEQQRFRFSVEPLMLISLSVALALAWPSRRRPAS